MLEWPNRRAWRARVGFPDRGFESHPLRQIAVILLPAPSLAILEPDVDMIPITERHFL